MRWTGVRPGAWLAFYLLWTGAWWWLAGEELGYRDAGLRWLAVAAVGYGIAATLYQRGRRTAIADALAGRATPEEDLLPAVDRAARQIRDSVLDRWLTPVMLLALALFMGVMAVDDRGPVATVPMALLVLAAGYAVAVQRRLFQGAGRWLADRPPAAPWLEPRSSWTRARHP